MMMSNQPKGGCNALTKPVRSSAKYRNGGASPKPRNALRSASDGSTRTALRSVCSIDMSVKTEKATNLSYHKRISDDGATSVKTEKMQNLSSHTRSARRGDLPVSSSHSRESRWLPPSPNRHGVPCRLHHPMPPHQDDTGDEATNLSERRLRSLGLQAGDEKPSARLATKQPAPPGLTEHFVPILSPSECDQVSKTEQSYEDEDSEIPSSHRPHGDPAHIVSDDISVMMGDSDCQESKQGRLGRRLQTISKFLFLTGSLLHLWGAVETLNVAKATKSAVLLAADTNFTQESLRQQLQQRYRGGGARALQPDCYSDPTESTEPSMPFPIRNNPASRSNVSEAALGDNALHVKNVSESFDLIEPLPVDPVPEASALEEDESDSDSSDDEETETVLLPSSPTAFALVTVSMFAAAFSFSVAGLLDWIRDRQVFHVFLFLAGLFGLFHAMLLGFSVMGSLVSNSIAAHCFLLEALLSSQWNRRNPPSASSSSVPDAASTTTSSHAAATRQDTLCMADIFFVLGALITTTMSYISYTSEHVKFHIFIDVLVSSLWALHALIYMITILTKHSSEQL